MDRHDVPGASAEDAAAAHVSDLETAPRFGVDFMSYWFDSEQDAVFCFARAPSADSMTDVHEASHGLVPAEIIEVSENDVVRFLGKVNDPADASEITSPFRIIGFTDLVSSTEMLNRLGLSEFMVLLTEHDLMVRKALLAWHGREVKHTGDGFMVSFDDAAQALGWAQDVRDRFGERPDLDIRIGLAAGEPVDHDDDIFGATVNMANRISDLGGAQQIFVSDVVRDLGAENGFEFDDGQTVTLKGFSEPATVYELLSSGSTENSPSR